ncbi:protein lethal(2)essential for life isoform X2 [Aethina tumida]|uniref:protein lethal(2)essential for life isoform X2 n=1 Tax=Aethina tumida TaxID=116153 RepID=UPI00096B4AC8|nr:protein lethal(2)essential for life isoform X2 [Aethina tumida]
MSSVPLTFRDWWIDDDMFFSRPSRLMDQQFGLGLRRDDLLNSLESTLSSYRRPYIRPWRTANALQKQDSGSTIQQDKDKFQVILDVQQFAPNEITVKTSGSSIVVEGKHEEKQDEHGYISRHFVRRYILPSDHDINQVSSSLSSDGILTVNAPKKSLQPQNTDRVVPIEHTGPAKATVTESQPKIEHPN